MSKGRAKQLTPRERRFLRSYLGEGKTITDSYKDAIRRADGTVPVPDTTAKVSGWKMLARIRANAPLWNDIIIAAGIDDVALAGHLNRMLRAMKTEFYQGVAVAEVEDNSTQMRAVELLADVLGKRKAALDVTGSLGLSGGITVVLDGNVSADGETDSSMEDAARPGEACAAEGRSEEREELRVGTDDSPAGGAVPGEPAPGGEA